jgi:AcrR family transcriptional regulator
MSLPPTRSREQTRARLLDAAVLVFGEVGLAGASVEAICERAGFTRGAFYSNFASKEELFIQLASSLADARLTAVDAQVRQLVDSGVSLDSASLGSLVSQVMDSVSHDRTSVMMMNEIRTHALRDKQFAAAYIEQEESIFRSVEGIIGWLVESGAVSMHTDTATAARMLVTVWEGAVVRLALEGADDDALAAAGNAELSALVGLLVSSD